jgi:hypothetical protein
MFNKKLIAKLRQAIIDKDEKLVLEQHKNDELVKENNRLLEQIDTIESSIEAMPDGCKLGTYCEICEFGKCYIVRSGWASRGIYVCNKHEACSNFVVREDVKESKRDDKT